MDVKPEEGWFKEKPLRICDRCDLPRDDILKGDVICQYCRKEMYGNK